MSSKFALSFNVSLLNKKSCGIPQKKKIYDEIITVHSTQSKSIETKIIMSK